MSDTASEAPLEGTIQPPDAVAKWECTLSQLDGGELTELTVGQELMFNCQGNYVDGLHRDFSLAIYDKKGKPQKYFLHRLETLSSSETDLKAKVTSYRAGTFKDVPVRILMSNGQQIEVQPPLSWSVKSVIEKPEQKPYGAIGPIELAMPFWYWGIFLVGGGLILLFLIRVFRKRMDRKKLLEDLARHGTALSPFNQLNKDLRKVSRALSYFNEETLTVSQAHEYMAEIEKEFRLFLIRELSVPALNWSNKEILKEIERYHPKVAYERNSEISRLLAEFNRAKNSERKLGHTDCHQLLAMVVTVADGVFQIRRGSR
jgi:hypothetical protein